MAHDSTSRTSRILLFTDHEGRLVSQSLDLPNWVRDLPCPQLAPGDSVQPLIPSDHLVAHGRTVIQGLSGQTYPATIHAMDAGHVIEIRQTVHQRSRDFERAALEDRRLADRLKVILSSAVKLEMAFENPRRVYHSTFESLSSAIIFSSGVIQLIEDGELCVVATWGFDDDQVLGLRFPIDERFPNATVFRTRQALSVDDVRSAYPHFRDEDGEYGSSRIQSWLGVPLLDRGSVIGMIALDRNHLHAFDAEDIEIAQALANHAAVALSNASMYERLEHANNLQLMLLRELHHRVKNSLQLVSSMLSLRSHELDERAATLIGDLRTHIQALAATHDNIFQPGMSQDVELSGYLRDIAQTVTSGYAVEGSRITCEVRVPEQTLCPMTIAVPVGLIVSELILNAHKHAFQSMDGQIVVSAQIADRSLDISVGDTGIGFPDEAGAEHGHRFGMTLVHTLVEQVEGTITRPATTAGTTWIISVPLPGAGASRQA